MLCNNIVTYKYVVSFSYLLFIWISYVNIQREQNNHGQFTMEQQDHPQQNKSGLCW